MMTDVSLYLREEAVVKRYYLLRNLCRKMGWVGLVSLHAWKIVTLNMMMLHVEVLFDHPCNHSQRSFSGFFPHHLFSSFFYMSVSSNVQVLFLCGSVLLNRRHYMAVDIICNLCKEVF